MFKDYRIHLLALGVFFLVTSLFNAPVFSGKTIEQNDIKQYRGSAREIHQYRDNDDRQILWTNVMFAGMPSYVISTVYGGELLKFVPKAFTKTLNPAVGFPLLLMIGFYILALSLKVDPLIGIAGALAYGFSTYFMIVLEAGHNSKIHAMAYLPGILAGMIWAYRQKRVLMGTVIFALFAGLELTARHPQMFYYFLFLAIPYGIWELVQAGREKQLPSFIKTTLFLVLGGILAVGANLPYLSNTYEYGKHTIRGKSELTLNQENKTDGLDRDYVTNWSYGVDESWTLLVPNFKGGPTAVIGADNKALDNVDRQYRQTIASQNSYFGDQPFTSGPVYAGAVVFLLAFLAFFFAKGSLRYVLIGVLFLAMALAWGKNFQGLTDFFLDNVPLYDKFRAVASFMVIPELILPLLAIIGLGAISKMNPTDWKANVKLTLGGEQKASKVFYIAAGILIAVLALNYAAPETFNSYLSTQEAETLPAALENAGFTTNQADAFISDLEGVRMAIFKTDVLRSLMFVLLGAVLIVLFQRGTLSKNAFLIGISVLILADMFPVNKRYLNEENFIEKSKIEKNYGLKPSPADQAIIAQYASDPYFRTLNLTVSPFNDATTSFFHYSLGGYHGAKLQIYQELVEQQLGNEIDVLRDALKSGTFRPNMFSQFTALNMLNTRYIILNPNNAPLENPARLGHAWLVKEIKAVADANAEIAALAGLDAGKTAILRQNFADQAGSLGPNAGQGSIRLKSYDPEKMVYEYTGEADNLAVFSEIYYPGNWVATIGGEEVEILKANYVLRALKVPAGTHEIIFEYRDQVSGIANTIAFISSLLILIALPGVLYWESKKAA
jgi:hypothetical protein